MNQSNRERLAWLVSVVLVAMLALQIPDSLAHRDSDYAFVRTLVDIHRQVTANYVDGVDEDALRQGAIDGMLEQLDPFSTYVPPKEQEAFDRMLDGTFKGIGVQLDQADNGDIRVISPIEGSPAFRAGVLPGDLILRVNGEDIKGLKIKDVQAKIASGPLQVTLRVRHEGGQEIDLPAMERMEIVVSTVKGYRRKADSSWDHWVATSPRVGYVRVTQFTPGTEATDTAPATPDTADRVKAAVLAMQQEGLRGLILDLRFNPGGRLDQAVKMVNLFVKQGVIVSTRGRNRPEVVARADPALALADNDFPMIVLVNEHSASASEVVAGSLMDNGRALVLGARTYGKGSVQEVIPLEQKGGELKLTVAHYYLPSGRLVHKKKDATDWGVDPQINVPMNTEMQKKLALLQMDQDIVGRPLPKAATRPTTASSTAPTSQPVDLQLEAAVSTMVGHIVLKGKQDATVPGIAPTTVPATNPMTMPTTSATTRPAA